MTTNMTVVFTTALVVRKDGTTNQLSNVDATCTVQHGHKQYSLFCSDLGEFLFPDTVVLTTSAGVQEFFTFLGLNRNDDQEVQAAMYYRQDCNGTAHFLKLFND